MFYIRKYLMCSECIYLEYLCVLPVGYCLSPRSRALTLFASSCVAGFYNLPRLPWRLPASLFFCVQHLYTLIVDWLTDGLTDVVSVLTEEHGRLPAPHINDVLFLICSQYVYFNCSRSSLPLLHCDVHRLEDLETCGSASLHVLSRCKWKLLSISVFYL